MAQESWRNVGRNAADQVEKGEVSPGWRSVTVDDERPEAKSPKHWLIAGLRLLTFGTTLTAFVMMITSEQTVTREFDGYFGAVTYKWSDSTAFSWFVIANAIVFIYSLAALVLGAALIRERSRMSPHLLWSFFVLDLIMMNIVMSACAASFATVLLGQSGNYRIGWGEICSQFSWFCGHTTGAVIAGAIGFASLVDLCLLDAYYLANA